MGFRIPYEPGAFGLDRTSRRAGRGDKDAKHLTFVRKFLCCACGSPRRVEAAHVRYGDPAADKPSSGLGQKPADRWAVPLCEECHRTGPDAQHNTNERAWWQRRGIDPLRLAQRLYAVTGDITAGQAIVAACGYTRGRNP